MNLSNEITTKLVEFEKFYEIDSLSYQSINIWPLIRLSFYKKKLLNSLEVKQNASKAILNTILYSWRHITFLTIKNKPIFIGYSSMDTKFCEVNGKSVHRSYHPLQSKEPNLLLVNIGVFGKYSYQSNSINISLALNFASRLYSLFHATKTSELTSSCNESLNRVQDFLGLDKTEILQELKRLNSFIFFFRIWFKYFPPAKVYFAGYYNLYNMAACLVANQMKIITVDYQHGQQGENHPMYSNWSSVPLGGFQLLPQKFWLWEKRFDKKFSNLVSESHFHKVDIIGNLLLNLLPKQRRKQNLTNSVRILYCMQYKEIDQKFMGFIKQQRHYNLLLRMHPRFHSEMDELNKQLLQNNIQISIENLEKANKTSIYDLLINDCDILITGWSTVAYEAYQFGIPVILLHENALGNYRDYINNKEMFYAKNSNEINSLVEQIQKGYST